MRRNCPKKCGYCTGMECFKSLGLDVFTERDKTMQLIMTGGPGDYNARGAAKIQ